MFSPGCGPVEILRYAQDDNGSGTNLENIRFGGEKSGLEARMDSIAVGLRQDGAGVAIPKGDFRARILGSERR